ncbi:MAG TPA: DUF4304 domain-containing protein [Longimicrobium sp.]|nr:DUF4304 domain-containing protein [Longimicrobium sp.]
MTKSASTKALDAVQARLAKLLKPHGFVRGGRTFRRDAGEGVVQVINLQMRPFADGALGGAMAPVDRFTVNLGIFIPELRPETPTPDAPVQEYDCALRARIGDLLDPPRDHWWDLPGNADEPGAEMLRVMEAHALPFLERFGTRDAVIAEWIGFSEARGLLATARADVATLLAARGEVREAR